MVRSPLAGFLSLAVAIGLGSCATEPQPQHQREPMAFRGVLLEAFGGTATELARLRQQRVNAIALMVREGDTAATARSAAATRAAGLKLWYWLEIGRHEPLAAQHPEWMASLQGHPEWRRFHPRFPQPAEGQVVKNYPWVPVAYRGSFEAHLARARELLRGLPTADGVFLNDLQGAPSACGCGHPLCRWTTDYGLKLTATPLSASAAAEFVTAIQRLAPASEVVPVWAPECEAEDKAGLCAGVDCFAGRCWVEWTRQLMPVAGAAKRIGVLALAKTFARENEGPGPGGGWVQKAVASFGEMPPRRGGQAVPAHRLIVVLEGWELRGAPAAAQIDQARQAGAGGFLLARTKIDQSWQPRLMSVAPGRDADLLAPAPAVRARLQWRRILRPRARRSGKSAALAPEIRGASRELRTSHAMNREA